MEIGSSHCAEVFSYALQIGLLDICTPKDMQASTANVQQRCDLLWTARLVV